MVRPLCAVTVDRPPARECPGCACEMDHVGRLPRAANLPMLRIYRCSPCKAVVTVNEG